MGCLIRGERAVGSVRDVDIAAGLRIPTKLNCRVVGAEDARKIHQCAPSPITEDIKHKMLFTSSIFFWKNVEDPTAIHAGD